jgi:hypothetical protein
MLTDTKTSNRAWYRDSDRIAWTLAGLVWHHGASWTDYYTGTPNGQTKLSYLYCADGVFWVSLWANAIQL